MGRIIIDVDSELKMDKFSPGDIEFILRNYTGPSIARAVAAYHAILTQQPRPLLPDAESHDED